MLMAEDITSSTDRIDRIGLGAGAAALKLLWLSSFGWTRHGQLRLT